MQTMISEFSEIQTKISENSEIQPRISENSEIRTKISEINVETWEIQKNSIPYDKNFRKALVCSELGLYQFVAPTLTSPWRIACELCLVPLTSGGV